MQSLTDVMCFIGQIGSICIFFRVFLGKFRLRLSFLLLIHLIAYLILSVYSVGRYDRFGPYWLIARQAEGWNQGIELLWTAALTALYGSCFQAGTRKAVLADSILLMAGPTAYVIGEIVFRDQSLSVAVIAALLALCCAADRLYRATKKAGLWISVGVLSFTLLLMIAGFCRMWVKQEQPEFCLLFLLDVSLLVALSACLYGNALRPERS